MSVGIPVDQNAVNFSAGGLAQTIQRWTQQVPPFKAWLDTMPDADLQAPPFNFTAEEVALLKSAVNDMNTLAQVYLGTAEHTPAARLDTFVQRISGIPV